MQNCANYFPFPLTKGLDVIGVAAKTTPRGVNFADLPVENAVHSQVIHSICSWETAPKSV